MATISGVVYDDNGDPVAGRVVRAYRRDTGALLGSGITTDGSESGDPEWSNVRLMLKGDGTNGGTSFADTSPLGAAVTRVNAITSTTQTKFQSASMYFDGSGDRLSVPELSLTLPFTIEAWLYPLAADPIGLFDSGPGQTGVLRNFGSGRIGRQGASDLAFDPPANEWTWNQLIFEAVSGNLRLTYARGGTQIRQGNLVTGGTTFTQGSTFVVGGINNNGDGSLNAYVSEFRITNAARSLGLPAAALPTGAYVPAGDPGSYVIDVGGYTGEVQRIVLDDDGGTLYNDIIDRVFPG